MIYIYIYINVFIYIYIYTRLFWEVGRGGNLIDNQKKNNAVVITRKGFVFFVGK